MRRAKISKIEDYFEGGHPNIQTGFERYGFEKNPPKVGESYKLYIDKLSPYGLFTTPVTDIIDETTFKTRNSLYKLEYEEDINK